MAEIIGLTMIKKRMLQVYSAFPETAMSYHWIVKGGKILHGQGKRSVLVDWSNAEKGSIELDVTTEEGFAEALVISVKILN